jgi:hypothetical protein
VPVYHLYNTKSHNNFYTTSEFERNVAPPRSNGDYVDKGVSFYAYGSRIDETLLIYRLYHWNRVIHFYTSDAVEKNDFVSTMGFELDKNSYFYAYASMAPGRVAVQRLFNPSNGSYLYTKDPSEFRSATASGYQVQRVAAFYVPVK